MEIGPILRALGRNRARFTLIVLEVAFTLAIVVNCMSLILDARSEMARTSGFDDEHLIWVASTPFAEAFEDEAYMKASVDADVAALRHLPGVVAASHTTFLPWQGGGSSFEVRDLGTDDERKRSQYYLVDPDIFRTLGVEVVEGRGFTEADYEVADDAQIYNVVISQGLARLLYPEGDALGKTLEGRTEGDEYHVVGIFDPFYNPYGWPIHEYAVFFASRSGSAGGGSRYLVRVEEGALDAVYRDIEPALLAIDDGRNLRVLSVEEVKARFHASRSTLVAALNGVMALLVLVTGLGIVGLTAFSVAERRRHIGTRRALGATRGDIVRHFLLENWLVTTLGLVLGAVLAYGVNIALVGLVAGARLEWQLVVIGALVLWLLGLGAALGPALRGARVPPAIATRSV